jgi:hypothetical protein
MFGGCNTGGSQVAPAGPEMGYNSGGVVHSIHLKPQWSELASLVPEGMRPRGPMPLMGRPAPDIARRGIYVSEFYGTSAYAYMKGNRANNGAICTVPWPVSLPNGIAVDGAGNFIEPDGGTRTINVGQGPNMCGAMAATIADPYGQPASASSANALTGTIAVGNIFDNSGAPGSISVCTVSAGCTQNLTNPGIYELAGVAMDNAGNCYADAIDPSGFANLTYFAGCTGSGVQATGFSNVYYGGIDIDASGNLVTIDTFGTGGTGAVDVYSGCNPACTLVGGPFPLIGNAVFGHLNSLHNNKLAVADVVNGQIDIYRYGPTSLTYAYSFNNGLSASLDVEGAAYNKRSPQ